MEVERRREAEVKEEVVAAAAAAVVGKTTNAKFPLTFWEITVAAGVVVGFVLGIFVVYMTMPASDYSFLKLPRSLEDIQILRDHLESYTSDYTLQVLVGYCLVYIFMQTFMIPGTVFMSLLAGSLFGVFKGVALVVFNATAGASSCYFLSKLIGKPLVFSLWPDKLGFFQDQKGRAVELHAFLRVTPTLPNTFINVASPIVDVPYHIFFLATFIGLIPAAYVTVQQVFPLKTELLKPQDQMERHITDLIKKSMGDVTGVDFIMFMNFIQSLSIFGGEAPPERVKELMEIIEGQADLDAEFNVTLVLYAAGRRSCDRGSSLKPHVTGNLIDDWWFGIQLNPQFMGIDIKFLFVRAGMMGWLLINLSVLAKSIRDGNLSQSMILYQLYCVFYILDYFIYEEYMTSTGESMENALCACCKGIKIGKILIHRDGDNGKQLIYGKLPKDISERHVLLLDLVLATAAGAR